MPCGGISPTVFGMAPDGPCGICDKEIVKNGLFVEEWDMCIHRECLGAFLISEEGTLMMGHGHRIYVPELE